MQAPLPLTRAPRDRALPLSPDQYRIWFLHQLKPELIHFNINFAFRIRGPFQAVRFADSLNAVIERHEALRTTFELRGQATAPELVIHPRLRLEVPEIDLTGLPAAEREAEARRQMELASQRLFSLERGPLLGAELYRLGAQEVVLLFTIHHIVADFDSLKLITRDLFHFYNGEPLAPLPLQFADYAAWQQEKLARGELDKQLEYWKQQLGGEQPVLRMPMDRPRAQVMGNRGAVTSHRFGRELTARLQELSKHHGVTLFVTLCSAYQALLHHLTGQLEINLGTPITTRNRVELKDLVGLFINTLVLRSELAGDPTFLELLKRNRKIAYAAFARQEIPYERLVEELRPQRSLSHNLFFQTMVMLLEPEAYRLAPELEIERFELAKRTTTFELTLTFTVSEGQLEVALDYNTDLYDEATAVALLRQLDGVLRQVAEDPHKRLGELSLLSEEERAAMLARLARQAAPPPGLEGSVHQRFAAQARRTPAAEAVRFRDQALCYRELDERANQLAHWLIRQGVTPGARVGLALHRSLELVVGMLGILKAGAAYVPMDPSYPAERLAYMIEDAGAAIVLTAAGQLAAAVAPAAGRLVNLDELALAGEPRGAPEVAVGPDDLMYVIYTSGSTGRPKGVMVSHCNVVNHCREIEKRFRLTPEDKVLQFTSPSFDVSVQEIFPTLLCGAALVLWKERRLEENEAFLRWTAAQGITVLNLTTAHWNNLVAELRQGSLAVPEHLKLVIAGGEKVAAATWRAWDQAVGGKIRFLNDYGLTETTITATMFEPPPGYLPSGAFPAGTPLDGVSLLVLDERGQLVPDGVFGELYVGGAGVAKGYLGKPALTAERFVPNPFGAGRLFKTGDRARIRRDGELEIEGRADEQVKIRGHRVELEEIEACLARHPQLARAVVAARDDGQGALSLAAYVVPRDAGFDAAGLQAWMRPQLPEVMVPADVVVLAEIPLTVNGKVDKARLPAPVRRAERAEREELVEPRSEAERLVAEVWREVLRRPQVGLSRSFFELGGDSLLATRVIALLKQRAKAQVPLRLLFEHPALADFAAQVEAILAGKAAADRCLVRLRASGSRTPLFYVHPVGGTVSCYFSLARQLGADQPFAALQSHAMICPGSPHDTVEKMAAHYLTELREAQPRGPYRLGGWSMGGFIAYEMARLLMEQGERVEELSMIDTYLTKTRVADEQTILFNFARQLTVAPGQRLSDETLLSWAAELRSHADVCRKLRAAGLVPSETTDEEVQHLIDVYTHTVHAFKQYDPRPAAKLAIERALLFRARDSHEELGIWSSLLERVSLHHIDADHFGIVHHPDVGRILAA